MFLYNLLWELNFPWQKLCTAYNEFIKNKTIINQKLVLTFLRNGQTLESTFRKPLEISNSYLSTVERQITFPEIAASSLISILEMDGRKPKTMVSKSQGKRERPIMDHEF